MISNKSVYEVLYKQPLPLAYIFVFIPGSIIGLMKISEGVFSQMTSFIVWTVISSFVFYIVESFLRHNLGQVKKIDK